MIDRVISFIADDLPAHILASRISCIRRLPASETCAERSVITDRDGAFYVVKGDEREHARIVNEWISAVASGG